MAKRTTTKESDGRCQCGCGDSPKGGKSRFLMGHDARFYGRVRKLHDRRLKMSDLKGDIEEYAVPLNRHAVKTH